MKSLSTLALFVLGLCSLNVDLVLAKSLVRGDHRPRTLKHFSMQSRQLMKDDAAPATPAAPEDPEDPEMPAEDAKDNTKDNTDKNNKDDAPEDPQEAEEEPTPDPEVEAAMEAQTDVMNVTETDDSVVLSGVEEVSPDTRFNVSLQPFSLTVDGNIAEDELNLDAYLFTYMKGFMSNLVAIDLEADLVTDGEEEGDMAMPADNSTRTRTRSLRAYQEEGRSYRAARILTVQTFYYEGTATFEGPPMRTAEEVDAALTYALQDTAALQAHLETSQAGATVTAAKPNNPAPAPDTTPDASTGGDTAAGAEPVEDDGLSTTGLSIVIVASCVGGISLLIIIMVGLSGPSGSTSGKGGLPEQPLQ